MLEQLQQRHQQLLASSPTLQARLNTVLQQLEQQAQQQLQQQSPFIALEQPLLKAEAALQRKSVASTELVEDWHHYHQFLQHQQLPDNRHFWQAQLRRPEQADEQRLLLRRLMLRQWRTQFEQRQTQWQLQQLSVIRQQQWQTLKQWLDLLCQLSRDLSPLGIDPGHLVDFSSGELSNSDISKLQQWAQYLQQNPEIYRLCVEIGKQRKPTYSEQIEWITVPQKRWINQANAPAKEELFGVELGRELSQVLPAELAQLADDELQQLFDLKYAEQRLTSFELKGWQSELITQPVRLPHSVSVEDNMGPMILCIDSSLSMQGAPETIVKAVALYLAATANAQQRQCYLINFSTKIDCLALSESAGAHELLAFLSRSFNGGTDVAPALQHALTMMSDNEFQHADMVILSDFVMTELDDEITQQMVSQREQGNRCYGVAVAPIEGELPLNLHMDKQWHYDPEQVRLASNDQEQQLEALPHAIVGSA